MRKEVLRILEPFNKGKGLVFRQDGVKERAFYRCVRKKLAAAVKAVGLADIGLHTLRHTFASHLVMAGVDLPTVQKLMGHHDIKTTMRYAHLAPDHLRAGMAMLDFSGHYVDTKSLRSKISLDQDRRKTLGDEGFNDEK